MVTRQEVRGAVGDDETGREDPRGGAARAGGSVRGRGLADRWRGGSRSEWKFQGYIAQQAGRRLNVRASGSSRAGRTLVERRAVPSADVLQEDQICRRGA